MSRFKNGMHHCCCCCRMHSGFISKDHAHANNGATCAGSSRCITDVFEFEIRVTKGGNSVEFSPNRHRFLKHIRSEGSPNICPDNPLWCAHCVQRIHSKVDSVSFGWFAPVETWAGASWGFFIGLYPLLAIFPHSHSGTEYYIYVAITDEDILKNICSSIFSAVKDSDRFCREICISKREICSGIKQLKDTFSRFQNPFHRTCAGSSYKIVDRISFNANIFWFDLTWWIMDRYSGQKNCRDLCGPRNI